VKLNKKSWQEIEKTAAVFIDEETGKKFKLDYSEASIKRLDKMITHIWGNGSPSEDKLDFMVWIFGCYVAAVINKNYLGSWAKNDDGSIHFMSASGFGAAPFNWLAKRFELGDPIYSKYSFSAKLMSKKTN
jgi:hypothetical protein